MAPGINESACLSRAIIVAGTFSSATLPPRSMVDGVLGAGHHFQSVNWVAGGYKGEV